MAGISKGPIPWWQTTPQMGASLTNLQNSAPPGYEYDPVQMSYVRTPTSAGQNVADFTKAALGGTGLSGLQTAAGNIGVGGAGTAGVSAPATGGPVGGGGQIPGIGPIDTSAATSAAFGAAKDQSGQEAQASLKSLRGLMGAEGLAGSGLEAEGNKGIVEKALGEMGTASRQNATTQASNALTEAEQNQNAAITQRGQDIAAEEANASLAQQQAALQANSSLSMLKLALGLLPQVSISGNSNGGASASASLY